MIGALEGKLLEYTPGVIVMVGGVGYHVYLSNRIKTVLPKNETVFLYIYSHIREDIFNLYGFLEKKDLEIFQLLLTVSGIGPKTALLISEFSYEQIIDAVLRADVSFFTAIPKVGKKNAQKIIIELKNKVGSLSDLDLSDASDSETEILLQTLVSMGFSRKDALLVYQKIPDKTVPLEEKIRYCLQHLSK